MSGMLVNAGSLGPGAFIGATFAPQGNPTSLASNSSPQAVDPSNSGATLPTVDTHGFWSAAHPTRLTIPTGQAGYYKMAGNVGGVGNSGAAFSRFGTTICKNGTYSYNGSTQFADMASATQTQPVFGAIDNILYLNVGDYIELCAIGVTAGAVTYAAYPYGLCFQKIGT